MIGAQGNQGLFSKWIYEPIKNVFQTLPTLNFTAEPAIKDDLKLDMSD